MTLLLATDIRVARRARDLQHRRGQARHHAGNGGTQRILEQLPYAIGMEMLLTGDSIDAQTAAALGPRQQGRAEGQADGRRARDYAQKIAANAPLAVQAAKELAVRSREMDRATGLRFEAVINRMLQFTEDAKEGPAAFAEKRPPELQGPLTMAHRPIRSPASRSSISRRSTTAPTRPS